MVCMKAGPMAIRKAETMDDWMVVRSVATMVDRWDDSWVDMMVVMKVYLMVVRMVYWMVEM